MAVTYKEQYCISCDKDTSFQVFSSFTGLTKRCIECGYTKSEPKDKYKIPTIWDILEDDYED